MAIFTIRHGINSLEHYCKTNISYIQTQQNSITKLLFHKYRNAHRCIIKLIHNSLIFFITFNLLFKIKLIELNTITTNDFLHLLLVRGLLWYSIVSQQIVLSDSLYKKTVLNKHDNRFTHNEGFVVPKCTNKYGDRNLIYIVPKIYNNLLMTIKNNSHYTFKDDNTLRNKPLDIDDLY